MAFALSAQHDYKNAINITPSSIVNLSGRPGLEMSYERRVNEKSSYLINANYINDFTNLYSFTNERSIWRGAGIGLEYRNYFHAIYTPLKKKGFSIYEGFYASFGSHILYTNRIVENTFILTDDVLYEDQYVVRRSELAIYGDIGYSFNYGRLSIETSLGLGILLRNTTHANRVNKNHEAFFPRGEYFLFEYEPERTYTQPLLRYQFGVGYNF